MWAPVMSADRYRAQAEALLKLAAQTDNMQHRSRLIDEAAFWHCRALDEVDYGAPEPLDEWPDADKAAGDEANS